MTKSIKFTQISNNPAIDIALDTIKMKKQAIVFVNSKASAEKTAEEIAKKSTIKGSVLYTLSQKAKKSLSKSTKQCERLSFCIESGIAFHHAGLVSKQRELIEDGFRNGDIKIICATPTLAMGCDLPAFRAIIKDLRRYSQRGYNWIPVLEYMQQSGRAGRPTYDTYGESIAIANTQPEKDEIINRYLKGVPEPIYSKLAVEPVLRTYVLSLVATGFTRNKKDLMEFFQETFWAHQYRDMQALEKILEKIIHLLTEFEFIRETKSDFVSADKVNSGELSATLLGKRVSELYIDPLTANHLIQCIQSATSKVPQDFSYLQMISSTLEMRPLLKSKVREYDDLQETLIEREAILLQKEPSLYEPEYDVFLDSIKTALFFEEWINEKDEEYLRTQFNVRPGEIRVKLDRANWLLYSAEEMAKLMQFHKLVKDMTKLKIRLKYGVKEELLALLRLRDIGRVRARKLFKNKIKDVGDIKKADVTTLVQILGKKTAISVKKQVGIDINPTTVKKTGQISLMDF